MVARAPTKYVPSELRPEGLNRTGSGCEIEEKTRNTRSALTTTGPALPWLVATRDTEIDLASHVPHVASSQGRASSWYAFHASESARISISARSMSAKKSCLRSASNAASSVSIIAPRGRPKCFALDLVGTPTGGAG